MLPPFELSYAIDRHRKVEPDAFLVAPRGGRALLWFCSHDGDDACYSFRLDGRRQSRPTREMGCFSHELCAGTLLYGVLQEQDQKGGKRFMCEDVLWCKGDRVERFSLRRKICLLQDIFDRGLGPVPSTRYMDIALPVWSESAEEAERIANACAYPCRGVFAYASHLPGLRPLPRDRVHRRVVSAPRRVPPSVGKHAVLVAQACIEPDTYSLLARGPDSLVRVGRASVPSIKTSVMMNRFLRKIKENENLDLLEESDSDEEFEDIAEDRYIHGSRYVAFKCAYNVRHQGWEPIEPMGPGTPVTSIEELRASTGFSNPSTHAQNTKPKKTPQQKAARGR